MRKISHNATFCNRNVHISATKWYIVGHGNGALWDLYNRPYYHNVIFNKPCHEMKRPWIFDLGCILGQYMQALFCCHQSHTLSCLWNINPLYAIGMVLTYQLFKQNISERVKKRFPKPWILVKTSNIKLMQWSFVIQCMNSDIFYYFCCSIHNGHPQWPNSENQTLGCL